MNFRQAWGVFVILLALALFPSSSFPQQTLGSVDGTVTDSSGAVLQKVTVVIHNVDTGLAVTATAKDDGSFKAVDLPIGTYSVTFTKQGFNTEVHSQILVRGNLTTTVNASLRPGEISSTVTVEATPLLNETDTTNGYTLGTELIQNIPLGTGSFTQLAILSPGVNADLLSGSGTNAGFGNQNIWANGQRSTSNGFNFNGVNANNIFNGNSSSSISANRAVLNTGENFKVLGGEILTGTSVYNAIGQGLPTAPPETIEELRVNTSMYDASQGANAGAHIELTTKSGTNAYHGQVYEYHQTTGWNANRFFFNADGLPRPPLHRNTFGGLLGGPIIKDKLFFFGSYQGIRATDLGASLLGGDVPPDLTNARDRASLAKVANNDFLTGCGTPGNPPCITANQVDPVALKIMNAKLPNGQFLMPNPTVTDPNLVGALGFNSVIRGPASRFTADQFNANIDYNLSSKDRFAGKYYYQRNPTFSPFSVSDVNGFAQSLKAGSQALSLVNTTILSPNLTWEQRAGFIRQDAFATTGQAFSPSDFGITIFGFTRLPGITINNNDSITGNSMGIGPASNFSNAGVFQNLFEWASSLNWVHGRHTVSTGLNWDHTQLNVINRNDEVASLTFSDFSTFLTGALRFGSENSVLLNGPTSRYYRANQVGSYVQDNIKVRSNLSVNLGVRFDWDGPLSEEHGQLTNFYPQNYSYSLATDTITNIGLVVAGNNKAMGTKGVSASTLTGRQWGFGPRIGLVWSPSFLKNFVARAGFGMYYDRGELFTLLSPPAGGGISGPFGVTTEQPFVVPVLTSPTSTFSVPFGTTPPPPPPNNLLGVASLIPNIALLKAQTTAFCKQTGQSFCGPLFFGGYDPRNTLPYSENWTLDLQWQPWNTLLIDVAYVGNHGVHETLQVPFNQPGIATAQHSIHGQTFTYGYKVPGVSVETEDTLVGGFPSGNAAIRAPFIGFDGNSDFNEAEGISHYNALQFGVTKRLSHGLQIVGSYTWSHALDEGSGIGLFFNGNDPLNPKSAYGSSDFDRTHVLTISYLYQFPKISRDSGGFAKWVVNGWGISGITVAESGQPYSVIDFSGGAASLFFGGGNDLITNPIIPIGGVGATSKNAVLQGTTGVNAGKPVLNAAAFGVPLVAPGQMGVPPCEPTGCDTFETGFGATGRNIFRGPFQARFDFAVTKDFKLTDRFSLKYDAQVFNLFNHPSFDTPNNDVRFNPFFAEPPIYGFPGHPACVPATGAYQCPPSGSLGIIQHTLGSPRFIQMALHLTF